MFNGQWTMLLKNWQEKYGQAVPFVHSENRANLGSIKVLGDLLLSKDLGIEKDKKWVHN